MSNYTCPSTCLFANHPGKEHESWVEDLRREAGMDGTVSANIHEILAELHVRLQTDTKAENETTKVWDSGYREALHDVLELFDETVAKGSDA